MSGVIRHRGESTPDINRGASLDGPLCFPSTLWYSYLDVFNALGIGCTCTWPTGAPMPIVCAHLTAT